LPASEHNDDLGEAVREAACKLGLEGVVSKQIDSQYSPGNRGIWVKSKCLNRAEFVIVGWTDPEGSRSSLGALLLGYYGKDGALMYAGRVGTGFSEKTLRMVHEKLKPLAIDKMPLAVAPPRKSRFGGTLSLSKVHWVRPKLVAEVTYLTMGGFVELISEFEIKPGATLDPHSHHTLEFYYVLSGRGIMTISGEDRQVGPGDLITIPPDAAHSIRPIGHVPIRSLAVGIGLKD
jgi:quercetin dioxygenase-like cupin family protein